MSLTDTTRPRSIVDWGAILAGAAIATATGLVLLTFGGALGLSVSSPYDGEGLSPIAFVVAAGLWLLWVQLMSFYMGGYVAARLRTRGAEANDHEVDVRDGLHGFLVWSTGVIVAAVITFAGVNGATSAHPIGARADLSASVTHVIDQQVGESAAVERSQGAPEAATASPDERRAEVARKLAIISAFITAASLLAGAVAAFFGAGAGGRHRDRNTVVEMFRMHHPVESKR